MNTSVIGRSVAAILLSLVLGVFAGGCSQGEDPKASQSPEASGTFTGQNLPTEVEELEGTPLYSVSEDFAKIVKLDGAPYLLIAPQDPLKALLILEPGVDPAEVKTRESKQIKLSGTSEPIEAKELIEHVKQQYELDLKTDENGKVVVLRVKPSGPKTESSPASE